MAPNRPAEPRAEPTTAAGPGIPNTRAGRLLLGKNSGSDRDPATVEWLLNDILAIEAEARAATPPALDVERLAAAMHITEAGWDTHSFEECENETTKARLRNHAEAIAAEYARLSAQATEETPR